MEHGGGDYYRTTSTTGLLQDWDYYRIITGLLQDYYRTTAGLLKYYYRTTTGLLQDYYRTTTGLLQNYYRTTAGLLQCHWGVTICFKNLVEWKSRVCKNKGG